MKKKQARIPHPHARRRGGQPGNHRESEPQASLAHSDAARRRSNPTFQGEASPIATGRKRGGQPDNHNALKHGFYSALFKENERRLLDELPVTDLSAEIELIRVTNTRFMQALQASKGSLDYEANLTALRAVNLSAQSIAALLRIQVLTGSLSRDAAEILDKLDSLAADDPAPDENHPSAS